MVILYYTLTDSSVFIVGGFSTSGDAQTWANLNMPDDATAVITPIVFQPTSP